jgi:hypothetical protein
MADYVEPSRWNDEAAKTSERASKLRKEVADSSSPGSRIWQTMNNLGGGEKGKASDAAIRHIENMKESEAEDLDQRTLDQYPKGTKSEGRTSRNLSGYGKKVELPSYKKGGSIRGGGCETKGKTKGRMV